MIDKYLKRQQQSEIIEISEARSCWGLLHPSSPTLPLNLNFCCTFYPQNGHTVSILDWFTLLRWRLCDNNKPKYLLVFMPGTQSSVLLLSFSSYLSFFSPSPSSSYCCTLLQSNFSAYHWSWSLAALKCEWHAKVLQIQKIGTRAATAIATLPPEQPFSWLFSLPLSSFLSSSLFRFSLPMISLQCRLCLSVEQQRVLVSSCCLACWCHLSPIGILYSPGNTDMSIYPKVWCVPRLRYWHCLTINLSEMSLASNFILEAVSIERNQCCCWIQNQIYLLKKKEET